MKWVSVVTREWPSGGPLPPDKRWGWKAIGLRDDGYYFYASGDSEEDARQRLAPLINDEAPPWRPLSVAEIAAEIGKNT